MVFLLDSKIAKVCKSCRSRQELSNEYLVFTCKIWRRYSRERASQSLPKISQKLGKKRPQKVRKNVGLSDSSQELETVPISPIGRSIQESQARSTGVAAGSPADHWGVQTGQTGARAEPIPTSVGKQAGAGTPISSCWHVGMLCLVQTSNTKQSAPV